MTKTPPFILVDGSSYLFRAFHALPARERIELVRTYLLLASGFDDAEAIDRSPAGADPLWVVAAQRKG